MGSEGTNGEKAWTRRQFANAGVTVGDGLWLTWWMTTSFWTYWRHRGSEFRKASKHSDICDTCCEGNKVRQRLGEFIAANKEHITSNHWTEHPPPCQPGRRVDSDDPVIYSNPSQLDVSDGIRWLILVFSTLLWSVVSFVCFTCI